MSARQKDRKAGPADDGRATRLRLSLVAIFSASALIAGIAALVERKPAQVTLTLNASEVAFKLHRNLTLNDVRAASVQLSKIGPVQLEIRRASVARYDRKTDQPIAWMPLALRGSVVVQPPQGSASMVARVRSEHLALTLDVQAQSEIRIAAAQGGARTVRLEVIAGKSAALLDVGSIIELQCDHCVALAADSKPHILTNTVRLDLARRQLRAEQVGGGAVVSLERPAGQAADGVALAVAGLMVDELRFHRIADGRLESTLVEDGRIAFAASKAPAGTIRRGDFLRLECRGPALLRSLEVSARVKLDIECDAATLRTGTEGRAISRLPSYLEWWYSNNTVTLFVAAFLSVGSTILVALQRLGYLPRL